MNLFHNERGRHNRVREERKLTKFILTRKIHLVLFEVIDPLTGKNGVSAEVIGMSQLYILSREEK